MAKKHPTSSRVHRDDGLPDDVFVSTMRRIISWAQENRQQMIVGSVAILLVAAAGAWFIASQRSVETAANTQLARVQQSVASGNNQLAIRDLQSFLNTYGSTEAADQARLILASVLIDEDRATEAVEALATLPERLDNPLGLPAARLKASALESLDRTQEAIDAYLAIAEDARFPFQRREALADAARVHLQNGNPERAVDLYQQVVDTFDEQEAGRGYYQMWLAEARAQVGQGAPAATPDTDGDTG